ncbi:MAG: VOC family protein, partial [Gaiellaceae bacterium]
HFAVGVTGLDAACEELRERGVGFLVEPRDYPSGRSAYLRDPDGRLVELRARSADSARRDALEGLAVAEIALHATR